MELKGISNQITIALIINFGNFKILVIWWLFVSVEEPLFNLHDVIHEYVILTRLSIKIILK